MRIILSGPPSIGKTTQGKLLSSWAGGPHISSGDLIRQKAASGDFVAKKLADHVADGSLAPSRAIIDMVFERLSAVDCESGFVVDGFPRKVEEAEAFLSSKFTIDALVILEASMGTLESRLLDRSRQQSFVRVDDDPASFARRIAAYKDETVRAQNLLSLKVPTFVISADESYDVVHSCIKKCLASFVDVEDRSSELKFAF